MAKKAPVLVEGLHLKEIKDLIPYINNSRTHTDHQINQVAASIREFGFLMPILIDSSGMIIAGHCRVAGAQKAGLTHVPAVIADHLNELQIKAYVIADNKLAENAGWDDDILRLEILHLADEGFDTSLLGFDDDELKKLNNEDDDELKAPKDEEYKSLYEIIVECDSEAMQESLYERFQGEGFKCRILSM